MAFLFALMTSSPIFFFAVWTLILNNRSRDVSESLPKKELPDPCLMEFQREFEKKLVLAGIPTELSICSDKSCRDCHPKIEQPTPTPVLHRRCDEQPLSSPREKPELKKKTDFKKSKTLEFFNSDLLNKEVRRHKCDWDIAYNPITLKHRVYFYDCYCSLTERLHGEELKKRTEEYLKKEVPAVQGRVNQIVKEYGGGGRARVNGNISADEAFKTLARKFIQEEKDSKSNPFV